MSYLLRLFWLFYTGVAAQRRSKNKPPTLAAMEDGFAAGEAGLLLDRRLVKAHGSRVTNFISVLAASFLPPLMLFLDSVVLSGCSAASSPILDVFTLLLSEALPAVRRSKLLFRSSRDAVSAASFHRCCRQNCVLVCFLCGPPVNAFARRVLIPC
jgi:hypothetical protein